MNNLLRDNLANQRLFRLVYVQGSFTRCSNLLRETTRCSASRYAVLYYYASLR
jgi:hypothetical protein